MTNNDAITIAYDRGYEVSEDGSTIWAPTGREIKTRIVKCNGKGNGYHTFTAYLGAGKNKRPLCHPIKIYRLLAYLKFGKTIFNKTKQVYFIDGNTLNPHIDNIGIRKFTLQTESQRRELKRQKSRDYYHRKKQEAAKRGEVFKWVRTKKKTNK